MLPREFRLGTAADFAAVIKAGRRAGTSRLVVHASMTEPPGAPRAGFVVSGKVGNSVVRHRVTRRLRPLVRDELRELPSGVALVIRALPSAAAATSAELGADLRAGVTSALRKATAAALQSGSGRSGSGRSPGPVRSSGSVRSSTSVPRPAAPDPVTMVGKVTGRKGGAG